MTTHTIAVISAGLRVPSSTRLLADQLGGAVSASLTAAGADPRIVIIELREHAHAIADALLTGFAAGALADAVAEVVAADALVVVTPTFGASYSGLFKSFIDILEPESLRDKPVLLAATGGTERHSLMLEHALRPLFSYLKTVPVGTAVYAATADFGGPGAAALATRVDRAAGELAAAVARRGVPSTSPDGSGSAGERDAVAPGAEGAFVPFDQLLARVGATGVDAVSADTAYERLRRAEEHIGERRFLEAVPELQAVLAEPDPGVGLTEARTMLARAYFGSAQLRKAEATARELLADNPSDAYAAQLLGRALQRQSKHAEAAPALALARALGA